MMTSFRKYTPYVVPLFLGASFFVAAKASRVVQPELRLLVLVALCGLTMVVVGGAAIIAARAAGMSIRKALHVALIPTIFSAGSFGLFTLVEHSLARYVVAVVAVGLLAAHFMSVLGMRGESARYGIEEINHLAFVLQVIASFFCFSFAFGVSAFTTLPEPFIALATGLGVMLFVRETLWQEGFSSSYSTMVSLAFGVLGMEFFFALSFLPTTWAVDAAVALILLVSALHATIRILKGVALPRRQFMLTFFLTLLVLGTARWT